MSSVLVQFKVPIHVYARLVEMGKGSQSANLMAKTIVENAIYEGGFKDKAVQELLDQTVKISLVVQQLLAGTGQISDDEMPDLLEQIRVTANEYLMQKGLKNGE